MLRKILLPVIFLILSYGFWISPNVKEIAAGVAIFLFGMLFLEEGFGVFTGGLLERILQKTTNKLWKAISLGIISTTIMQSSSLVSVITISFLSAGLIWLSAGVGIIFGANIGTTTGAWLVAGFGLKVKISAYAMPMLVFGIILVFQKIKSLKGIGYVLAGLGFLFLGIHHMKEGFEAFRDTIDLVEYAMPGFAGLVVFSLIGLAATVIMQSSHATLVLIITALAATQITYENALALAIGANVGTTVTAIIGAMSSNYQGKRLAAAHLIFNVVTGAIAIIFISQLMWLVDTVSENVGIRNDDFTLKLAVFHTIFNLIGVAVMLPFVSRLVSFLQRVIPKPRLDVIEPKYINEAAFDFPETLIHSVRQEILYLYEIGSNIIAKGLNLDINSITSDVELEKYVDGCRKKVEIDVRQEYKLKIKPLSGEILEFISKAHNSLEPEYGNRLYELREACHAMIVAVKAMGHLRKNVVTYSASDNEHIRREYNAIRLQIAEIMRDIHNFELADLNEKSEVDVLLLDVYKVTAKQENPRAIGSINAMLQNELIEPAMGTSLVNDLDYAERLIWNLAEMGKIVFGASDEATREVEDMLALTEDEMDDEVMEQADELQPNP